MVGFNFTPVDEHGDYADNCARLLAACEAGDSDRVHLLVKGTEAEDLLAAADGKDILETRTPDGATPLFIASKNGHIECARILLRAGAAIDAVTSGGLCPLWIAAQKGQTEMCKLLLNHAGVKVDQPSADLRTPLYAACEAGDARAVRLLIASGANVEARRKDGSTPLIVAAYFGHGEVVEALLEAKAKLSPGDPDGTALQNARKMKRTNCIQLLEKAMKDRGITEGEEDEPLVLPAEG